MKSLRPWATPLTIATTLVTVVTGGLLFFHASPGLTRVSHEWIGMAMVVAVVAHVLLNLRALTTYFKRPVGLALMSLGAVTMAATLLFSSGESGASGGMRVAMTAMNNARIETLADLAGQDTDTVLARLDAAGIDASAGETLSALAGEDHAKQDEIIGLVFAQ